MILKRCIGQCRRLRPVWRFPHGAPVCQDCIAERLRQVQR